MSYKLRDIDRIDLPKQPKSTSTTCKCGHDRSSHYYGKTDRYAIDYHACLVTACDCTTYEQVNK